jgi:hypothetical protein
MSSRVDLLSLSLSTKPLRVVHESKFVVMLLQPGAMDVNINGAPTDRCEYAAADIDLCRRHVVGLVQSRDKIRKLRFELSDLHLSEAVGQANREIELQRYKPRRLGSRYGSEYCPLFSHLHKVDGRKPTPIRIATESSVRQPAT